MHIFSHTCLQPYWQLCHDNKGQKDQMGGEEDSINVCNFSKQATLPQVLRNAKLDHCYKPQLDEEVSFLSKQKPENLMRTVRA